MPPPSLFFTCGRERLHAAGAPHLSGRIDAQGTEQGQIVHVDAELHLPVALDQHARRRGPRCFHFLAQAVQANGGIENDVEVVTLVADPLNVLVDAFRVRDRIVDCRAELSQKLFDFVVQGSVPAARQFSTPPANVKLPNRRIEAYPYSPFASEGSSPADTDSQCSDQ